MMEKAMRKFRPDELKVFEGMYWMVTVRGKQVTYGDMVILPKQPYEMFADIPVEAACEFFSIAATLETVVRNELGAKKVNLVAAMMKDPFVHFHFFPRYNQSFERDGIMWYDIDWPSAITLRDVNTSEETLQSIHTTLVALIA